MDGTGRPYYWERYKGHKTVGSFRFIVNRLTSLTVNQQYNNTAIYNNTTC